jgi:CDGSH-type Zn-finger protein/uncharacterized Fe-S cluster protein YjdI
MGKETYVSDAIDVIWDGDRCIHARRCVTGLPHVFNAGAPEPWITPGSAPVDAVVAIAHACPSGAIRYLRKDGGAAEAPPEVNTLRLWENGPVELRADIVMAGTPDGTRRVLCRCGLSAAKPFCDGSHKDGKFTATGEVPAREGTALESRGGPVEVTPLKDGPVKVKGNLEILSGSGQKVTTVAQAFLCRCGRSGNKPFCDGTHKKAGFAADGA